MNNMLRIAGVVNDSIVDGAGLRVTVFLQGCMHNCKGCQNPQTHDVNGGRLVTVGEVFAEIKKNPLIDGVTFSGGEPFLQSEALIPLAQYIKNDGLSLVIYTGYLFENIVANKSFRRLAGYADIIVDGKFIESEKTLDIPFVGSKNQRIIDAQKSLQSNSLVLASL